MTGKLTLIEKAFCNLTWSNISAEYASHFKSIRCWRKICHTHTRFDTCSRFKCTQCRDTPRVDRRASRASDDCHCQASTFVTLYSLLWCTFEYIVVWQSVKNYPNCTSLSLNYVLITVISVCILHVIMIIIWNNVTMYAIFFHISFNIIFIVRLFCIFSIILSATHKILRGSALPRISFRYIHEIILFR